MQELFHSCSRKWSQFDVSVFYVCVKFFHAQTFYHTDSYEHCFVSIFKSVTILAISCFCCFVLFSVSHQFFVVLQYFSDDMWYIVIIDVGVFLQLICCRLTMYVFIIIGSFFRTFIASKVRFNQFVLLILCLDFGSG